MARDGWLGLSGFALLSLHAHWADAQNVNCLFRGDDADGNIQGDVEIAVPCTLANVEIDGDVIVFSGGSLVANDVHIKGNLYTSRADFIAMERGQIDGNVRLEELVGDETTIQGTTIDGNILLARNRSRLEIVNNDIHGGMFAVDNTGGLLISGNSFETSLECLDNAPEPFGIANRVDGGALGQCADLRPEGSPPEPAIPPPATSPPSSSATPADTATPPASTTSVATDASGGGGALGWPAVLLLPLLFLRRSSRGKPRVALRSTGIAAR
jgi:hypothetical protein